MSSELKSEIPGACPDPLQLGRAGWDILHSSAAVYPYKPTKVQQEAMHNFIESWSQLYACSWCAYHMRQYVAEHPPRVENKLSISRYVCELHNEVSGRLGKDQYDCDPASVLKRWHPGYPNKMDDQPSLEERVAAEEKRVAAEEKRRSEERKKQQAEEARLSAFHWQSGRSQKGPEAWRETTTATGDGDDVHRAARPAQQAATKKDDTSNAQPSRRWWFFGGPAYSGEGSRNGQEEASGKTSTSTSVPPPHKGKTADAETDVDAVLARLRGCQVYCPEDEEIAGNKTLRR